LEFGWSLIKENGRGRQGMDIVNMDNTFKETSCKEERKPAVSRRASKIKRKY
jgi:hypothetical protein